MKSTLSAAILTLLLGFILILVLIQVLHQMNLLP